MKLCVLGWVVYYIPSRLEYLVDLCPIFSTALLCVGILREENGCSARVVPFYNIYRDR